MNALLRKYRRFRAIQAEQGSMVVLRATLASLINSVRYRLTLRRAPVADNVRFDAGSFLPARQRAKAAVPTRSAAVIIPVYRDLVTARACLDSVLSSASSTPGAVVVIDDASPEPALSEYLDTLAAGGLIRLLRNKTNLGFVGSVNRGMVETADMDVVLLNSDTVVAGDWLDRLAAHVVRDARVGTVTPFSNSATICSYPTMDGWGALPSGETVATVDAAFRAANAGRAGTIPTAVGFCMYVSRACLDDVGLFDALAFRRGYGEENDFCLRAAQRGWLHLLAADTFVWHSGEVSFGASATQLRAAAQEELQRRYPDYHKQVASYVEADPARPWRVAASASRFRLGRRPVVLMVTHALGGGTEKHLLDLCRRYENELRTLVLQPTLHGAVRLWCPDATEDLDLLWDLRAGVEPLAALLRSFGVSRVHIHNTLGLPRSLRQLPRLLEVPVDVTIHDFYFICPRVRLVRRPDGQYCGGPEESRCEECLASAPHAGVTSIAQWHEAQAWVLTEARRVICPSRDAAGHLAHCVNGSELIVAPHETLSREVFPEPVNRALGEGEPLRVAILGALTDDKGARVVQECLQALIASREAVEITLIGFVPRQFRRSVRGAPLSITGAYEPADLPAHLARVRPHVVWFPAIWPETYSYTLSEAMRANLPVLVPDLGAFTERVQDRRWSWRVASDLSPSGYARAFAGIAGQMRTGEWGGLDSLSDAPRSNETSARYPVAVSADFYDRDYLQPLLESASCRGDE